jgi:hypothetical protein
VEYLADGSRAPFKPFLISTQQYIYATKSLDVLWSLLSLIIQDWYEFKNQLEVVVGFSK